MDTLEGRKMTENLVTSEELVKLLGVSSATVNYYTNLGLFKIKDRRGNRRLYEKNEIRELHDQERLNKGYRI